MTVTLSPARPRWRETLGLLARNPTALVAALSGRAGMISVPRLAG